MSLVRRQPTDVTTEPRPSRMSETRCLATPRQAVSLDWPLSREEKRHCIMSLYEKDLHVANTLICDKEAVLEELREEVHVSTATSARRGICDESAEHLMRAVEEATLTLAALAENRSVSRSKRRMSKAVRQVRKRRVSRGETRQADSFTEPSPSSACVASARDRGRACATCICEACFRDSATCICETGGQDSSTCCSPVVASDFGGLARNRSSPCLETLESFLTGTNQDSSCLLSPGVVASTASMKTGRAKTCDPVPRSRSEQKHQAPLVDLETFLH